MKRAKGEGREALRRFRLVGSDGAFLGWIHRVDLAQAEDAMLEFGVSVEDAEAD